VIELSVQTRPVIDSSKLTSWERFKLLLHFQKYVLPYWDKVLVRCLCSFAMALMGVIPALLGRRLVDVVFPEQDTRQLVLVVMLMLGAYFCSQLMALIGGLDRGDGQPFPSNIISAYTLAAIAVDLKHMFYRHVQKLSLRFYVSRPVGEHVFRCTADVDDAAFLASETIPKLISTLQRILLLFLVLQFLIAPWIKYPMIVYLVIFFGVKHWLTTRIRRNERRWRVELQRQEAVLREILFPFSLIWAYTRKRTARRWYGSQACRSVLTGYQRGLFWLYDLYLNWFALPAFIAVLPLIIGKSVLDGNMTLGDYTAVGAIAAQFIPPFQDAITTIQLIRQKLVPAERMVETLAVEPELVDAPGAVALREAKGKIELRDVWFSYTEGIDVLKGVSIVANPGEKIAIVGPTGAGKSTLCSLIARLYDPQAGELLIDDTPYRKVTQESLGRHVSIAMQNIVTFTETIKQNILYARPRASDEEVMRVARMAHVDEFVSTMENGYDTVLSESGSISGGQKQRLCLARALIRDANVLILDEATSALDPVTEKQVVANIDEAYSDKTVVVVAHNVLNARTADRIYVMDDGRIVETGTHDELMAARGLYRNLWARETQHGLS